VLARQKHEKQVGTADLSRFIGMNVAEEQDK